MDYDTHKVSVFGETLTFLSHSDDYKVWRIRGDWMTPEGLLDGRGEMRVRVTPDGRAWSADSADYAALAPHSYELRCERWGDMERIGASFCPDIGEFDHVGIKPILCGSAAADPALPA